MPRGSTDAHSILSKTLTAVVLSTLINVSVEAGSCLTSLKVSWDTWAPFHYQDAHGQMQGYAVQVLNEMAKRAQCKLSYVQRPWKRTLNELATGDVDLAMETLKTPEREQFALFSGPYSPTVIQLYHNTNSARAWNIRTVADLERYPGVRIGVARGDSFGSEIDQWLAQSHPGIVVDVAPTMQANLQKLAYGRIDLAFASSLSAIAVIKSLRLNTISPLAVGWTIEDAHFAFSKISVSDGDFQRMNQALESMRKDGKLAELVRLYRH